MTDTGFSLDSHSHSRNRSHDKDDDDDSSINSGSDRPRDDGHGHSKPFSHAVTARSRIAMLVRHIRSFHHVYLVTLPALYFRVSPLLFTHNSTPLSVYLAVVLVYIPASVVLAAWQHFSPSYAATRRKRRTSFLLPSNDPSSLSARARRQGAAQLLLWLSGALLSLWAYTKGLSSPFPTASSLVASSPTLQAHRANNASYFIAASFWNNDEVLDSWTAQTLELIDVLGRANVYVSLTENDSEDNTASKLLHFGRELTRRGVAHSVNITTDLRGDPPENPWHSIRHRMGYMANLRNGALEPLGRLKRRFENVVLLNDVVYHHTDVLKLVAAVGGDDVKVNGAQSTRAGKRRMACSIDMDGATLYDTWVLRDRCGRTASGFWPFFASERDRRAVREQRVLEVGTCWNGIVVLDGDMLLDPPLRSRDAGWEADTLRFQQPPECIISECMLLPLTITNVTGGAPVVMDPSVIVGYSVKWWRYYALWLRMPVVRLWMRLFEEGYWGLWWRLGMGNGLRWNGLDGGKEKNECVVTGWPSCDEDEGAVKGAFKLGN
ncbi:glycosyltransferase family 69 protein [Trichoderma longibrachiatum ATCC 18648]|uniref:Glycosyltransferase family 69 protein n=1 Tax=Trichoderma longibrachiatum ATCC 18648 TaxID=983965 RepID=A0A2T4C7Z8_TRILO|nr:glycosyltransferase family 69 protein [Trichoderma longibrachiatum ATCC 18648]